MPRQSGVYPRSRGGTPFLSVTSSSDLGLSPLARGNLLHLNLERLHSGSIPARAGEPRVGLSVMDGLRVYPRSRGGTDYMLSHPTEPWGLSPLARGNLCSKDRLR